ncbi:MULTISPECIES: ABC transporter permease [unclassified Nocardiopsis]|jgi:peptide/nickel transport system permease protein|uniref:ABC transporter permease n=1 Tax=unclassified Nocardiopsis TaxID=2649073 RepID=UPI00066D5782|nr:MULTISPECIES: ABC transporter permease [unclassified Nocardiopsis]MBQ1082416.1 ABC transporter permease [Nocardiopsis sp. B62]
MLVYTMRRILGALPVLVLASILTFVMIDVTGDPLADVRMAQPPPTEEVLQQAEERLYLDRSMPERYWLWVTGIGGNGDIGLLQGEFGPSTQGPQYDIGSAIAERLWTTLRLVGAAMVFALGLAIITGVVSALRQYSKLDYTLTFVGFLALALPTFWFAGIMQAAGVKFNQLVGDQVFATIGDGRFRAEGAPLWDQFLNAFAHMALPTIVLMLISFASWSRYQRTSMLEVMNSDYVRLARAKGLRNHTVIRRHALRTALIPLTTVVAIGVAGVIDGAILTEVVFQWRGLGDFFITAVDNNDSFALMGWLLLSGTIVILANLVADLLYAVLDPRIRYE